MLARNKYLLPLSRMVINKNQFCKNTKLKIKRIRGMRSAFQNPLSWSSVLKHSFHKCQQVEVQPLTSERQREELERLFSLIFERPLSHPVPKASKAKEIGSFIPNLHFCFYILTVKKQFTSVISKASVTFIELIQEMYPNQYWFRFHFYQVQALLV